MTLFFYWYGKMKTIHSSFLGKLMTNCQFEGFLKKINDKRAKKENEAFNY